MLPLNKQHMRGVSMPADSLVCADLMVSNGSSNSIEAFKKKNTKTEKNLLLTLLEALTLYSYKSGFVK